MNKTHDGEPKPDTDIPERPLPEVGDRHDIWYGPHVGHWATVTEIVHLGGRDYDITWTCDCRGSWVTARTVPK